MKKILYKIFICIFCCCIFQCPSISVQTQYSYTAIQIYNEGVACHKQNKYELAEQKYNQALKLQPDFIEAKKNLAIVYQNLAGKYYGEETYDKAIYYAKKSLTLKPNDVNCYNTIANCYLTLNDNENLIITYKKILSITPNDDLILSSLAAAYLKTNQLDKANETYKKILLINPNDSIAQQNLKYINFKHSNKILNDSINNLNVGHIAPEQLYRKIRVQPGVDGCYHEKMKTILDLIWNEPNGKMLLSALLKQNTSINIVDGHAKADVHRDIKKQTLYLYFIIPVASFTTNSAVNINLPTSYIDNFNNKNLYANQRIYNLQVFIHEFGHAFIGIKKPKDVDSIEEELGVSMIGYNIASKIINDKYLTPEQTKEYSENVLISLLSDEHKYLQVYSGFNKSIQKYGIMMPYPEIYSDNLLIYQKLLSEGKVSRVPSLDALVLSNNNRRIKL